jgi:hypothetical protein
VKRAALLAALSLAAALTAGEARAATVRVELDPPQPTVGDRVKATVILEGAPGELAAEPRFPVWNKTWGEAEVIDVGAVDAGRAGSYRQVLTLAAFRTGDVPLPPVAVTLPGGVELPTPGDVVLHVRSVLPANEAEQKPKPPLPPRALPWGRAFLWTLAGGLAVCLAAAAILFVRRRRAELAPDRARPDLAPIDELLARLAEIEERAGEVSPERAHTALSLALRRFLGRAFEFPAPESTTSEIQRQLRSRHLPGDLAQRTARLLRDCDAIKFALGDATRAELAARLAVTREIGAAIEGHLRPAVLAEASA